MKQYDPSDSMRCQAARVRGDARELETRLRYGLSIAPNFHAKFSEMVEMANKAKANGDYEGHRARLEDAEAILELRDEMRQRKFVNRRFECVPGAVETLDRMIESLQRRARALDEQADKLDRERRFGKMAC
ncbi:MAG: hypothetical protein Q8P30_04700 [Candidatus Uhrbacteria bacterium]|nr:hypothetical protein [Candidatus Uhrbacteria bacterium]